MNLDSLLKNMYFNALIFQEREFLTAKNTTSKLHDPKNFNFKILSNAKITLILMIKRGL